MYFGYDEVLRSQTGEVVPRPRSPHKDAVFDWTDFREMRAEARYIIAEDIERVPEVMDVMAMRQRDSTQRTAIKREVATLRDTWYNPSTWMNETWGPPIREGNRIVRAASRSSRRTRDGSCHPSSTGKLSKQYSGGKRKAVSPLRSRSASNSRYGRRQPRLISLRGPKRPNVDSRCVNCGGEKHADSGGSVACVICDRKQYCTVGCRIDAQIRHTYCSGACADESVPGRLLNARGCVNCGDACKDPKIVCRACKRVMYCMAECRDAGGDVCAVDCEYFRTQVAPRLNGGGTNSRWSSVDQSSDSDGASDPQDTQMNDDWTVIGHTFAGQGRAIKYQLQWGDTVNRQWAAGADLQGNLWTAKLASYWEKPGPARLRHFMELPKDAEAVETAACFERFVVRGRIIRQRDLEFDVRAFEDVGRANWVPGPQLEPAWDRPLHQFWLKAQVRCEWFETRQMVERWDPTTLNLRRKGRALSPLLLDAGRVGDKRRPEQDSPMAATGFAHARSAGRLAGTTAELPHRTVPRGRSL